MAQYNTSNSLSPMIFKKSNKKEKEGTRSERWRSKSMEHIFEGKAPPANLRPLACSSDSEKWKEVDKLKSISPAVTCILPSLAMDFVASTLLAVGSIPLITEGKPSS